MTETNYKLTCTSIEIKDPEAFTVTYPPSDSTPVANHYRFEMLTKTQTKKDMGLIRTVHHGQSVILTTINTTPIIPFFQYTSIINDEIINIGRIVLHITYLDTVDNEANKQLLQLVGTQQSATELVVAGNIVTSISTDKTAIDALGATKYTSNFYLDGLDLTNTTNMTQKWIIDLNKSFKSGAASSATASYVALGLLLKNPHSACKFKIDAYTEVITVTDPV